MLNYRLSDYLAFEMHYRIGFWLGQREALGPFFPLAGVELIKPRIYIRILSRERSLGQSFKYADV